MRRKAIVLGLTAVSLLWAMFTIFVPSGRAEPTVPLLPDDGQSAELLAGPDYDPARQTVCRLGCDYASLAAAISATSPISPAVFSILDSEISEQMIQIDGGKTVTIMGLGSWRTAVGADPSGQTAAGRIFIIEGGASVTLKNMKIWGGDSGTADGGAASVSGSGSSLTLKDVEITGNRASNGGAIAVINEASLSIEDGTITNNEALNAGGAIFVDGGSLSIKRTLIAQNSAAVGGGLFYSSDQAIGLIQNTTFGKNRAMALTGTTTASRGGGAIAVVDQTGGGSPSELSIRFGTLSENSTADGDGGALLVTSGTVSAMATIFANNLAGGSGANCSTASGTIASSGYNLATDAGCNLTGGTDFVSSSISLEPLADHAGASHPYEIGMASHAIGTVPIARCEPVDQRGFSRVSDSACDAGAYEAEKYLTFCNAAGLPIPDNSLAGLTSNINLTRPETIYDLAVLLRISNQAGFVDDLSAMLTLTTTSGSMAELVAQPTPDSGTGCLATGPTALDVRFADSFANPFSGSICFADATHQADYRPTATNGDLSSAVGQRFADVKFSLNLVDSAAGSTGMLENWCVQAKVKPDSLTVTRNDDPVPNGCQVGDCSLREAIIDANEMPGRDTITFGVAGPIQLTQLGSGEGSGTGVPQIGDLDITDDLRLIGNITDVITIDGMQGSRIFDIYPESTVEMVGLELTGGQVTDGFRGGAAILNRGIFIGEHLLIRKNSTTNNFGWGGAIQSTTGADFTLRHSEIISNSTASVYPAVHNWNSVMELNGVTIAGNDGLSSVVFNNASGGDAVIWISSVTLAQNGPNATNGLGNRWQDSTTVGDEGNPEAVIGYVHNSVISKHSSTSCDLGAPTGNSNAKVVSLGHNLIGDTSCGIDEASDFTAMDPLLGPLEAGTGGGLNGRLVLKPTTFSPLVDNGAVDVCPEIGVRGVARPQSAQCDIGAVELTAAEAPKHVYLPFVIR